MLWLHKPIYSGSHMLFQERGDFIGIHHNLLREEWEEICRPVHNPYSVTNKKKFMGLLQQGERFSMEGGMTRGGTRGGINMRRKAILVLMSVGICICSYYGGPFVCVSLALTLLTQTHNTARGDTLPSSCIRMRSEKWKIS